MDKVEKEDVSIVILAGGAGRRMKGQDKGLIRYKNKTLVEHVIDQIQVQSGNIFINANRHIEQYAELGYPVIPDGLSGYQGPLAGMLAAMSFVKTRYIMTLPCDAPRVVDNYLEKMLEGLQQGPIAVATDGERMQPVYALIPVSKKDSLSDYLQSGERKTGLWLRLQQASLVEFSTGSGFFTNLNSLDDLES